MQPASITAPTAQGKLSDTPLAHVLLFALQRRLSGLFKFYSSETKATVVVSCEIDCAKQPEVMSCEGGAAGLVRLQGLLGSKDAYFEFFHGLNLTALDSAPAKVDPVTWICQSSKQGFVREDILHTVLKPWSNSAMTLVAQANIKRLGFESKELTIVNLLQERPYTLVELYGNPAFGREAVDRVVYLLAITKNLRASAAVAGAKPLLEHVSEQAAAKRPTNAPPRMSLTPTSSTVRKQVLGSLPPSTSGRTVATSGGPAQGGAQGSSGLSIPPIPAPPGQLDPALQARWKEIQERINQIEHQTYFEMMGLSKKATDGEIQQAYFGLAKTLHPDRLPPALGVIRPQVQWLFSQYTEAYHTLTDQEKRTKYSKAVDQGGGTLSSTKKVQAIIEAAMEFQKAEVLYRRGDSQGAMRFLETALRLNPNESDYYVMFARILLEDPEQIINAEAAINRALELYENHAQGHFC